MVVSVKGIFKDGVAQPVEKVEGRDGEPVVITFVEDYPSDQPIPDEEAAWDAFAQLVESCRVETGISDLAHNHDHYRLVRSRSSSTHSQIHRWGTSASAPVRPVC